MSFIVVDTEDNTPEIVARGGDPFEKQVTQVAAMTEDREEFYSTGPDTTGFLLWLEQRPEKICYAHNLQYDLGNLFDGDLSEFDLTMVGGRLIKARWRGKTFLDSFNLLPSSAKKLGDALGFPKRDMDIHSREYVMRDVEIIVAGISRMKETAQSRGVKKLPNTLGGLCVKLWKSQGGENWPETNSISHEAIIGGHVELFRKKAEGRIPIVDLNSLYPWAMTQAFPGGLIPCKRMAKHGVTRCRVRVPEGLVAPLPYRAGEGEIPGVGKGAILYPCGRFTGTWTNHELRYAQDRFGVEIEKVEETYGISQAYYYYKDFIEYWYEQRINSDSEAYRLIYKLLLNNLFGQLGMSGVIGKSFEITDGLLDDIRNGDVQATVYGDKLLQDVQIPQPEHVNYCHAAHVLAYARTHLLDFMMMVGPEHMIYCDTDSLFFLWPENKALPFPISKKLGDMKLVGEASECVTIAPKMYQVTENGKRRTKAKGIKKEYAEEFIRNRTATYYVPFKMREAILYYDREIVGWRGEGDDAKPIYRKSAGANSRKLSVWHQITKRLKTPYLKKRIDGNQYFPLMLNLS